MVVVFLAGPHFGFGSMAIFNPKGIIALKERNLLITVVLMMLVVVIPLFAATVYIIWKYRAGNKEASYTPNWDRNSKTQFFNWLIPCVLIFIIGILNWKTTHELDPYKPIISSTAPITIQVVALQWKWLFIYPEQNIATVNFIEFPENTPLNFQLTADAPMNSFWIPQLGGQMYAMPGMSTQLHLMASDVGNFPGSAAEISGQGFAGMKFIAKSTSQADFDAWVQSVKNSPNVLSLASYNTLAQASENNPQILYSSVEQSLFNSVIMKFMAPASADSSPPIGMPGMMGQ